MTYLSGAQKEAIFCMGLSLVDAICELISVSLFAEINWTKHLSALMLQNATLVSFIFMNT